MGRPLPHPLEPLPATPCHNKQPGGGGAAVDHHHRGSGVVASRGLGAVVVAALHLAGVGFIFFILFFGLLRLRFPWAPLWLMVLQTLGRHQDGRCRGRPPSHSYDVRDWEEA